MIAYEHVQADRSLHTLGLMAAIQAGTASLPNVANNWVASPERSLGRESNGDSLRKAAGDMYAKSVLSSSPMLAFRNMANAGTRGVCNSQLKGMLSVQTSRPNSPTLSPCCGPIASLSQQQHHFDRYSENCAVNANIGGHNRGSLESGRRDSNPGPASPCQRPSRSLSTLGVSGDPFLRTRYAHSPLGGPQGGRSGAAGGRTFQAPHSLSPSSMRAAARTPFQRAVPEADSHGERMIHLSVYALAVLWLRLACSADLFCSVLG